MPLELRRTAASAPAVVATGPDWKASTAIREADFIWATLRTPERNPGWDQIGFNDAAWDKVRCRGRLKPLVQAHPSRR